MILSGFRRSCTCCCFNAGFNSVSFCHCDLSNPVSACATEFSDEKAIQQWPLALLGVRGASYSLDISIKSPWPWPCLMIELNSVCFSECPEILKYMYIPWRHFLWHIALLWCNKLAWTWVLALFNGIEITVMVEVSRPFISGLFICLI